MSASVNQPIVLRIYKGDQLAGVKQFLDEQIVIGRRAEAQVSLADDQVAIIHAAIERRQNGYYLCDLGSETGTFRNSEPVLDAKIESGDLLQIGPFRIEFFVGVPKPKIDPMAPDFVAPGSPIQAPRSGERGGSKPAFSLRSGEFGARAPSVPESAPAATPASGSASRSGSKSTVSPTTATLSGPEPAPRDYKSKKKKHGGTFAPASSHADVRDVVRPSKGTVVEVLVAWKERVIHSRCFSGPRVITMGSHPDCDIPVPNFSGQSRKIAIVRVDSRAHVFLPGRSSGEVTRGAETIGFAALESQRRLTPVGNGFSLALEQGEVAKVELADGVSVLVRYVPSAPTPVMAPFIDLTTSEATGVIMSIALVMVLALYKSFYAPTPPPAEDKTEDVPRAAIIVNSTPRPTPPPPPPPPAPTPTPAATPAPTPTPKPTPIKVKPVENPKPVPNPKPVAVKQAEVPKPTKDPGAAAANAAPNKNKTGPKTLTSAKQGGSIKTTDTPAAQMKTKDVTKAGMFSVLGAKGAQDEIAQGSAGAGELAGMANQATGRSGMNENRAGQGLGSAIKDTGVGGTGTAAIGVKGGVGTAGRGSGNTGYGEGGVGGREGVKIQPGGAGESFTAGYDKEAVRRVVNANLRQIKSCYEKQLNREASLGGKVVLEWDIAEQGRVTGVRTKENGTGNKEIADCVARVIKLARFPEPPPGQEVTVAYPFLFSN